MALPKSFPMIMLIKNKMKIIPVLIMDKSINMLKVLSKITPIIFFNYCTSYKNGTGRIFKSIRIDTIKCANTQYKANFIEPFISASAIPTAGYKANANGGVMPSIPPVIAGKIAATKSGFNPTLAKLAIIILPNMATCDEPGRNMPRIIVNIGKKIPSPIFPMLNSFIKTPRFSAKFISVNSAESEYAKYIVAATGTI